MDGRIEGKIVLITGAGGGIGSATARRFAAEGAAALLLSDLAGDAIAALRHELTPLCATTALPADLTAPDGCASLMAQVLDAHGRIDALVTTAAVPTAPVPFLSTSDAHWRAEVSLQLDANFLLGRAAAHAMVTTGGGSITFAGSIASLGASRGMAAYVATKTGLLGLMRTMAVELAPHGIRVNTVSPGAVDTPRYRSRFADEEELRQARASFSPAPLGRLCTPEEVASAFLFLTSDEASYVTGHNLVVDGGTTAQVRTPHD